MVTSNRAFDCGRAEEWRVLGLLLRRRAAQRERWASRSEVGVNRRAAKGLCSPSHARKDPGLTSRITGGKVTIARVLSLLCLSVVSVTVNSADAPSERTDEPNREALLSRCVTYFADDRRPPTIPLYRDANLIQETCGCTVDRLASNDRLSKMIASLQASTNRDAKPNDMAGVFGALLFCAGETIQRQAELSASRLPVAALGMAEALILPNPAAPPQALSQIRPRLVNARGCMPSKFPEAARKRGAEGTSTLAFFINKRGAYTKVQIVRSSGDTVEHKLLDFMAVAASVECKFESATKDGEAQEGWAMLDVVWRLR